jgi:hypothetical protein
VTAALDTATVEAIAQRVADLLRDDRLGSDHIDAAEVARRFGVSREYVYAHADELGAVRLGDGDKPRLRFDPATVFERLAARPAPSAAPPRATPRRRRAGADLLPIREQR